MISAPIKNHQNSMLYIMRYFDKWRKKFPLNCKTYHLSKWKVINNLPIIIHLDNNKVVFHNTILQWICFPQDNKNLTKQKIKEQTLAIIKKPLIKYCGKKRCLSKFFEFLQARINSKIPNFQDSYIDSH